MLMLRRPALLFAAMAACALSLGACADRPHIGICTRILELLLPADAEPQVISARFDDASRDDVELTYRSRDDIDSHTVVCRFDSASGQRFSLNAVEIRGRTLTDVQLFLLHRWLGQPPPRSLLEPPSAPRWSLGLHAAYLAQQVLNGIVIGAVIALVAVGYTLVYGITRHIQFAYGELLTIGAVLTGLFYAVLWIPGLANLATVLGLALPLVLAAAGGIGWTIERAAFRKLIHSGTQSPLIAAVGLSLFLQEFIRLSQGSRARWMPPLVDGKAEIFTSGGFAVSLTYAQVLVVGLAVALSLVQGWILARTGFGRRYRAVADDPRMAALLGVDVNAVIGATYALGAGAAALAGAAVIIRYGEAASTLGIVFGFKALTAALLGGIGSFAGALVGGILIGLIEALWAGYIGGAWRDSAVFGVLVLVLVYKPAGLFGLDDRFMSPAGDGAPGSALRSRPSAASRE